jgi:hypothetical protein
MYKARQSRRKSQYHRQRLVPCRFIRRLCSGLARSCVDVDDSDTREVLVKPIRTAATILTLFAVFSLTWAATDLSALSDASAPTSPEAYQLLQNPGMEQAFVPYGFSFQGVACEVATGWTRFGDTDPRPCWMDARDFAHDVAGTNWVEKIEGETSQVIISTEPYTAGIYQRVTTGVTPGLPYGFHAAMMTIFQSSAGPAQPGHMIKQVGMDPTGGTNPNAPTVVWSEPEDQDYGWDIQRRTAVVATSSSMTVFIRVISDDPAGAWPYLNQSYLDSAILARTATVSAVSPEISQTQTFTVRWDNAVASPDATIRWYDVQWMDEANGQWVDWLTWTEQTQATFTGQRGHTYRFRARAWQRYPNGAHLYSPYEPADGSPTTVGAPQLVGKVRGNGPYAFAGVTVSIEGTPYSTLSRGDGSYQMWVEPMADPHDIAISNPPWLPPEPVHGVTFGPMETVALDWTLRPPDDAVENGEFEQPLTAGWDLVGEPSGVGDPVHTGDGAALLGGQQAADGRAAGYTNGLEQTVSLSHSWNPNLSFWYLPDSADGDDVFSVTLTVAGESVTFSPSLDAEGWQHQWYSLGVGEDYFTGAVTIQFEVSNDGDESTTTVYLDEVSLGRTPGGPFKMYFPIIQK